MPSQPGTRVCFMLRLKPDRVDDYLKAHSSVWPEMLEALQEAGWHDYTLFVDSERALVVGYLVTEDFARAQAAIATKEVNERWQRGMAEYFDTDGTADQAMLRLTEYFHVD